MQRSAAIVCMTVLLAGLLVGCVQQGSTPSSEEPASPALISGGGADEATPAVPVPQIASGTMPSIKEIPTPTALPTSPAERHVVTLEQALAAATFTLYEPQDLPEKAYRDVVQLETAREGETAPGLPLVRFIYSVEPAGALIIVQRPADGSAGQGETVDIGGASGWLTEIENAVVVEWEQNGTRIQVRGNGLDRATVLSAARSMTPLARQP